MQYMPTMVHGFTDTRSAQDCHSVPTGDEDYFLRALALFCGSLSTEEQSFAERAMNHNWTIRVIVDHILEVRGQPLSPRDFDWRTL